MTEFQEKMSNFSLQSVGIDYSLTQVEELLAGIVAAPELPNNEWMALLTGSSVASLSQETIDKLTVLRESYKAHIHYGFTDGPAPQARVIRLRQLMKERGISAFIVPRTDEFQGEYVSLRSDRLYWLTGFAGSAGLGIVGLEKAAMFVDGRYTIQVKQQVSAEIFEFLHLVNDPYDQWLVSNFSAGQKVAYDPWLHTEHSLKRLEEAAKISGFELVAVDINLIDQIWDGQPAAPLSPVRPQPDEYAGETIASKINRLSEFLKINQIDSTVIAAPDCIAWLLNIRGDDVANCPLPLSFSILHAENTSGAEAYVDLFIDSRKLVSTLQGHFGKYVQVHPIESFIDYLEGLNKKEGNYRVLVDPVSTASRIFQALKREGVEIIEHADPVQLPRACKNDVELAGTREAHERDGVAMSRFLRWVDEEIEAGVTTELDVVAYLENCRRQDPDYRNPSFDTISGAGPNGAVVHYRVTEKTNRTIEADSLLLVDSGGQYPFGTTDITRTMAIGTPSAEMKQNFTLVLKGHIALAQARFPKGITGARLDSLARAPLWQFGLDYDHGTGHGVGSFLNVHEGPQRIATSGAVILEEGMILSNEPGYYKTDAYGIRIENLIIVEEAISASEHPLQKTTLGFETITLAPIDRRLVDIPLLDQNELDWLNAYHQQVYDRLSVRIEDDALKSWLAKATAPIV